MTLDLSHLRVESFETTVAGDPTQWLMGPPPTEGCDTNVLAPTPPYASCGCETYLAAPAETHERICTTV